MQEVSFANADSERRTTALEKHYSATFLQRLSSLHTHRTRIRIALCDISSSLIPPPQARRFAKSAPMSMAK